MNTTPRILGLDLSLTATGVCMPDGTTLTITTKTKDGDRRLVQIADTMARIAAEGADLAVIEDLPKHAMSAGITGMVHGIARAALVRAGIPYALVSPATLKSYATDNGAAGKADMSAAARRAAGVVFADDNQCDAWWLQQAGLDWLGHPRFVVPAHQRARLAKAKWPTLCLGVAA
ncbi:Holliday junction endonuclease [Kitasatospora camelliae]|uniref:Holliday junction endonuclease n=1 Tax=Kitasatospora camelliae TaxID=3156397 RepID=A0AAU8K6P6_9ACTN